MKRDGGARRSIALRARNASYIYNGRAVVNRVSFALREGQCGVLRAATRADTSPLLDCIYGTTDLTRGRIAVYGDDEISFVARRCLMGYARQKPSFDDERSILENLASTEFVEQGPMSPRALRRARGLMDRVGLSHAIHHPPSALSATERRLAGIIQALMARPKILLVDSPAAKIGPQGARRIHDLLADVARHAKTMLVATDDERFAREAADIVFLLRNGAIIAAAPPDRYFAADYEPLGRTIADQVMAYINRQPTGFVMCASDLLHVAERKTITAVLVVLVRRGKLRRVRRGRYARANTVGVAVGAHTTSVWRCSRRRVRTPSSSANDRHGSGGEPADGALGSASRGRIFKFLFDPYSP